MFHSLRTHVRTAVSHGSVTELPLLSRAASSSVKVTSFQFPPPPMKTHRWCYGRVVAGKSPPTCTNPCWPHGDLPPPGASLIASATQGQRASHGRRQTSDASVTFVRWGGHARGHASGHIHLACHQTSSCDPSKIK